VTDWQMLAPARAGAAPNASDQLRPPRLTTMLQVAIRAATRPLGVSTAG